MSALVWGAEWRLALSNKRDLALQTLGVLSLAWVLVSSGLPEAACAAACVGLFIGFGMLRTALPLFHDGRTGIVERVLRGGVSPASYLLQRAAAAAAIALVSLLPALFVASSFLGPAVTQALISASVLVASLWVASVVAVTIGSLSRSTGEVLVLCGVAVVLLLHMSGVFHTPAAGGMGAWVERVSPFRALHEAAVAMASGTEVGGVVALAAWAVGLPVVIGVGASKLTPGLTRAS